MSRSSACVKSVPSPPVEEVIKISFSLLGSPSCGSAWRVKDICLPSGDHESGEEGEEGGALFERLQVPEVRRFAVPPEEDTSQMCEGVGAEVARKSLSPTSNRS